MLWLKVPKPGHCIRKCTLVWCLLSTEVGIYKRKQENKNSTKKATKKKRNKGRKHALDQESDHEKKITVKK